MSDSPPAQGIPLQFIFICMHRVTGNFQRKDGGPLNVSDMDGPYDPTVVFEPLDLPADLPIDSPDHPPFHLLLRVCRDCTQIRRGRLHMVRQLSERPGPLGPVLDFLGRHLLKSLREEYRLDDMILMGRFLGHTIGGVQERVEGRLIEGTHSANENIPTHDI